MNLVLHAILRGQSTEPIVLRTQPVGAAVRLTVSMPGEPLRADWRSIFEPHPPATAASVGYGLGLALARIVAELHGGRIWIEEEPPTGSAFVFQLGPESSSVQGTGRTGRA